MAVTIRQWTVRAGMSRESTFESEAAALAHAVVSAGPTDPAVVITPEGNRFIILRACDTVEVSTRHVLNATSRRVVVA